MEEPLLQTKLYIPEARTGLISRQHLIERLNQGMERKLTLLTAPAGFGKTSLLSQWVAQADRSAAWLSLEKDDDEIARFLTYFIFALQNIKEHTGAELLGALQSPQLPRMNTWQAMLVNEIGSIETDFSLILDDYHHIASPSIHESLVFVLDHSPSNLHLIIAGRGDPFMPISRYRARGEIIELRMEDLRFSGEEAKSYFRQFDNLDLVERDVLALNSRTEGWIAGLHLAALSMQGLEEPSEFISDMAGDDRYILDYLADEVLARRPSGTRDFLIKTSVLERMKAQLCEVVAEVDEGAKMLAELEQANLFILPLDHRRRWYRYHRLFADLLRRLLDETLSQHEIAELHSRASRWFEEHELYFEAIGHSLEARDEESALHQIERAAETIFATGQLIPLTRLWHQFSRQSLIRDPAVCMIFAWAWLATGHLQESDECLRIVEESFNVKIADLASGDKGLSAEIRGALIEVAVIESQLALHRSDITRALELSQTVLQLTESEDYPPLYTPRPESRCVASFNLGLGHEHLGELSDAVSTFEDALKLAQDIGNIHIVSVASGHLAKIHRINGDLTQASVVCQRGILELQQMIGRTPMSSILMSEWGSIDYERNNLDAAQERFQEAIDLAKIWGLWEALVPAYVGSANIERVRGSTSRALRLLDELEELGRDNPDQFMPAVTSTRALFWALEGNLEGALDLVRASRLDPSHEISFAQEEEALTVARVFAATKRFDEADRLISELRSTAESAARSGRLIQVLILNALSLVAQNDPGSALEAIIDAMELAQTTGHIRSFLDGGNPIAELVMDAREAQIEDEMTSRLLAAFNDEQRSRDSEALAPAAAASPTQLVEPLSDRELEVLRWLRSDLSGPEIASELMIALSTLRTHTQNIYSKLGVSNRRAAVTRAEELALI
jgi:LuxR family maltose regulon positive regulatory protein